MEPNEWVFPATVKHAVEELATPGAQVVAGGTNVSDLMRLGHKSGPRLIDLSRLELTGIQQRESTTLIGALVSNTTVANSAHLKNLFPALSAAILSGASQQIRNVATVGGNLMQTTRCSYFRASDWPCNRRTPGSGCTAINAPLSDHAILGTSSHCIATHPSDMSVALLALNAKVLFDKKDKAYALPISEFYPVPGVTAHVTTCLPENALITGVELEHDPLFEVSGYIKLRGRASYEFASASVAAAIAMKNGMIQRVSIAVGGVATIPWRDIEAEQILIGRRPTRERIDLYCDHLLDAAKPCLETQHKVPLVRGAIHKLITRLAGR